MEAVITYMEIPNRTNVVINYGIGIILNKIDELESDTHVINSSEIDVIQLTISYCGETGIEDIRLYLYKFVYSFKYHNNLIRSQNNPIPDGEFCLLLYSKGRNDYDIFYI